MKTEFRNRLLLTLLTVFTTVATTALLPGFVDARECSVSKANCSSAADCVSPVGQTCDAVMTDYCIVPPFIQEITKPNLLMLIDNSGSMYDLAYVDKGRKFCSSSGVDCTQSASVCAASDTCTFTGGRKPFYCYDQTFANVKADGTAKTYVGYFESADYYRYVGDLSISENPAGYFRKLSGTETFANLCVAGAGQTVSKPSAINDVCVVHDTATPYTARTFVATGNYLNWLSSSKFDVEKQVLTGGKYDGAKLLAETRGCVGQLFIKEALTGNFENYNFSYAANGTPSGTNPNVSLGITFGVRGPYDTINPTAPSPGGQAYIDIYKGDYNETKCQGAVVAMQLGSNADIKQNVEACLSYTVGGTSTAITKTEIAFQQSMQACWQYRNFLAGTGGHDIGHDEYQAVTGANPSSVGCPAIYFGYGICSDNFDKTCTTATSAADCGAADKCIMGPDAILPGNPALLCNASYEGQHYYHQPATTGGSCSQSGIDSVRYPLDTCSLTDPCPALKMCSKKVASETYNRVCTAANEATVCEGNGNQCKDVANTCNVGALPEAWLLRPGVTEAMVIQTHRDFCGAIGAPPVTDPTDTPSDAQYETVPAILSGAGLEGQLNQPIGHMTVKVNASAPEGLIQEYKDKIRLGLMTFDFNGAKTESNVSGFPLQKVCSGKTDRACFGPSDCVGLGAGTCVDGAAYIKDGAKIIYEIGKGYCANVPATECATSANCTSGAKCIMYPPGTHATGTCKGTTTSCTTDTDCGGAAGSCVSLIKAMDDIVAYSWTPFSEAFYNAIGYFAKDMADPTGKTSRYSDLRLNATDYPNTMNPSELICQSNNILLVSDGSSTADQNSDKASLVDTYKTVSGGVTGNCTKYSGSKDMDDLAWLARHRNINTFEKATATTTVPEKKGEYISSYVVFNGDDNGEDKNSECNNVTLLTKTATNGGSTLLRTEDPVEYKDKLGKVFAEVAAGNASGTAASILNNSEGSGAILLQAIFFPSKEYEDKTAISWSGELINLWYYVDPFFTLSTIREDTDYLSGTHIMDIARDKRVQFFFDTASNQTMVRRYNFDGSTVIADMNSDLSGGLKTIWGAGKALWKRNLSTDPRKIYTTVSGASPWVFKDFSNANAADLSPDLNAEGADATAKTAFAEKVINFVHGVDVCMNSSATLSSDAACTKKSRNRTVKIKVSDDTTATHVWKLGDIISSTPKLQAGQPLQSHDQKPPLGYSDSTYKNYYSRTEYKNRGMVYVGANDGMLHAIRMGKIDIRSAGTQKATLKGVNLGREEWAFIPKHVLPYLKYLTLPEYDSGHLYLVDGANLLFDVATKTTTARDDYWNETRTGDTWKTVLLGGMGLGGATKDNTTATCTAGVDTGTCVKTPAPDLPELGFSSYYAIDVTNQDYTADTSTEVRQQPTLLWEFFHPDLGYATSGPAIVRLHSKSGTSPYPPQKDRNGRWFAIYASGPTGPIDPSKKQFKGKSDQNLKLFVVDIEKGPVVDPDPKKNGLWIIDTGLTEAFAGTISNNSVVDAEIIQLFPLSDNARQDDTVYIGYTQKADDGTWTDGGILRLVIPDSANPDEMDVSQWKTSRVVTGIGPVTTAVSKLMSKNNMYLFFGTGRFFYPQDDMTSTRRIAMVKELCYPVKVGGVFSHSDIIENCNESTVPPLTLSDMTSRNTTSNDPVDNGWYIDLDAGERVVTDTVSTSSGTVFYTSFKPTSDPCGLGGKSYLWGVRYDSGGSLPASAKTGKVLIQLSTGAFAELDLQTALSEKDGRRTAETSELSFGKASADAGLFMTSAGLAPVKRVLHIQERFK